MWKEFYATGYPARTLWPSLHGEHETREASEQRLLEVDGTYLFEGTLGTCEPLEAEISEKDESSIKEAGLAEGIDPQDCVFTVGYSSTKGNIQPTSNGAKRRHPGYL